MKKSIKASVAWSYYDTPLINSINEKYLPDNGEGDTLATQMVTAINKLIYKWYNDGDVFDNNYGMEGWANDLSSYANWLYKYIPFTRMALDQIYDCFNSNEYEELLKELANICLDSEFVEQLAEKPKQGSVYDCDGPFSFKDYDDDEDDDYYDDDYYDEDDEDDEDW